MKLKKLSLLNFKNYQEAQFNFEHDIVCLSGNNGTGKTNVLDAIYYLSFCKSYFNPIDSQNIRHGDPFFVIEGLFELEDKEQKVYCGVKRGQKKIFKRNGKQYDKLMEHIGHFPAVIISPADKDLVKEGSDVRRKFMDGIISQNDRQYLEAVMQYQKVLTQRNALLKFFWENRQYDQDQLEIWNVQLIKWGELIHNKRQAFMEAFVPLFDEVYRDISGGAEQVSLQYHSSLFDISFEDGLIQALPKDQSRHHTTFGIHKDDLLFSIGDYPLKKYGSQGQQKSFVIALKLAQFRFLSGTIGYKPLLLLDDIFDKIDNQRLQYLLQLVSDNAFGQIFITDTERDRIVRTFEEKNIPYQSYDIGQKSEVTI